MKKVELPNENLDSGRIKEDERNKIVIFFFSVSFFLGIYITQIISYGTKKNIRVGVKFNPIKHIES